MNRDQPEEYDFYEDSPEKPGLRGALEQKSNRQAVFLLIAFLLCFSAFSCIDRQLDAAVAQSDSAGHSGKAKTNPWAPDK